jgi:hypothetical protein
MYHYHIASRVTGDRATADQVEKKGNENDDHD